MKETVKVIRHLARRYMEHAMNPVNSLRLELHRKVNDLESQRPVVLIDELPWNELSIDDFMDTVSTDPDLVELETFLRRKILQFEKFPGDMVRKPYYPIRKIVIEDSFGINIEQKVIKNDSSNSISSHEYIDQFSDFSRIDDIHIPNISYDKDATLKKFEKISNIISDILPCKISGIPFFYITTWDLISELRGVTNLLMDLYDNPEMTHKLVRKLTDVYKHRLSEYERLGLFDNDPSLLHCTPIKTNDLSPEKVDGNIMRDNIWGRGAAQIFASVSKDMRKEYDIEYMKETIGTCGLSYYGCCESLDTMIDIIEELPNLRKISITPWADVDNAEICIIIKTKSIKSRC